jgi:hypothetical protein
VAPADCSAAPPHRADAWLDALLKSIGEANCADLPDICPWTFEQVLAEDYLPS